MQPEKVAEVRAWFRKVDNDLAAAAWNLMAERPLVDDALFHCQQAAEKAIKAFLTWHDRPFRKTHDIREVGGAAIELDETLEPLIRRCVPLTPFAGVFRYPGDIGEPTIEEAQDALALAREMVAAVLDRLPEDVRPTEQ